MIHEISDTCYRYGVLFFFSLSMKGNLGVCLFPSDILVPSISAEAVGFISIRMSWSPVLLSF